MEHTSLDSDSAPYRFHSGAPDASTSARAAAELQTRLSARAQDLGIARLQVERVGRPSVPVGPRPERLIEAYSRALVDALSKEPALVVLDAHLAVDTGQLPAR